MSLRNETLALLRRLGVTDAAFAPEGLPARSPITGETLATLRMDGKAETSAAIGRAMEAFAQWRKVPAPRRGEFVRLIGEELRAHKADLGLLVTIEAGKVTSEGLGEVQEMIDICDYAVGLSRQLFGLTIATERPDHRMMETWHPIGPCGVITAFNFPVAVWSWNAALAFVCGNPTIWKPSEKTPLTALAVQAVVERAAAKFGGIPEGIVGNPDRRPRCRRSPRRRSPRRPDLGDRLYRHGPAGRPAASPPASAAPSWNSAATTPPSSRPPPISTSPCAGSPSPRWARQASAAPPCAASSSMRASTTR